MNKNRKKLEELHTVIADSLTEAITLMKGMEPKDRNAAIYNAAIALIKNSGVKCDIEADTAVDDLLKVLPFDNTPEEERAKGMG